MKKAKEKFDSLVKSIKEGETVNFGQMEEVFAQAFLSKFLERSFSDSEQKKANQFYQKHLAGDAEDYYDDELPELSSEQQVYYALEMTRSVISALGVRPTIEDLSGYIYEAKWRSNWKLLEDILSLTKEGSLGKDKEN